ncbi:alanine racemase [Bifidobacterium bombi]|uniref:Alanine racemase n=1 Tax=Bifidobacterium bombi DSM 19703 TaxID=1341695 RepID=A0A080N631_9BIFI|nr:alanine racemase [Bifidobacterium bombi]KFF31229.1 alanine racemase [Bifidobacterium bombi DSM 19703]
MTLSALKPWEFSSPQGKANYRRARRLYPGQAVIDLKSMRDNMRTLVDVVGGSNGGTAVMGIVKADGYGHGLVPSALAALAGGATWLGTAQPREALQLRMAGIGSDRCHILTWMYNSGEALLPELIASDIDVSVGSLAGIDALAKAARKVGRPARVHVNVDTGLGRNGFTERGFQVVLDRLVPLVHEELFEIVGLWSHLSAAESPDVLEFVELTDRQIALFNDFTRRMEKAGISPQLRHIANTAATFSRPEARFDLVRPGIGLYGYEADPAMGTPEQFGLKPAMTLQAQISTVKDVVEGQGISYGSTYVTNSDTSTVIIPLGYADGIHRAASGFDDSGSEHTTKIGGPVRVMTKDGPRVMHVSGRVCMDQFVLDLGAPAVELGVSEGDTVELFGPGRGEEFDEPTADDWARCAGTISDEIFACLTSRIPRLYLNAAEVLSPRDVSKLHRRQIL